jgi:hypothetical protein
MSARKPWLEALENRLAPASVQFAVASETRLETAGTFSIPVTLSAPSASAVSVPFTLGGTAVAGTDFSGVTASPLVIPAGQLGANITGTLLDAGHALTLTLGAPTGASLGALTTNTLTISDALPSPTALAIGDASAVEPGPGGTSNLLFTVTRTGDLTSQVTVGFTTIAGSAQANTDFTPTTGTTTFASGSSTAQISIPIMNHGAFTATNLNFSVQLTGIVNVVGPPVAFASQTPFATGTEPETVSLADMNGDGKPDLLVVNLADGTVSVLMNTTTPGSSTPSFAAQQTFVTAGNGPHFVRAADVNGDGLPDLIVSNYDSADVAVLLNKTTPGASTLSFAPAQTFSTGNNPKFFAVADLTGDGKLDLIVANEADNTVSVLLNTTATGATTASFATQQTFATGSKPRGVITADVNGDGRPDLIVANRGDNTIGVLLNTTTPGATTASFATQKTFPAGHISYGLLAVADLNGDGKPDVAVTDQTDNTVSVLLNTTAAGAAAPSFAAQQTFPTGAAPKSIAVVDVNGDGKPDLAVTNSGDNTVSVLVNTTVTGAATVSFAPQQTFATGAKPYSVAVADLNGDGQPDLVVANYSAKTLSVLLNTTVVGAAAINPDFPAAPALATGGAPSSVVAGDLNGDGLPDLVTTNLSDNTVSVLANNTAPGSAPTFAAQQTFATGANPFAAALGDLNGDGKPDIAVANFGDNTVSVLLNTTTPGAAAFSFATQQTFATGTGPDSVALADLNGDGKPDLIVANQTDNTVSVLLNTTAPGATTATFAAQQTFGAGTDPVALAVADLNGDGKPDLIVVDQSANEVSVLFNTTAPGATTPTFAAAQAFTVGASPAAVAIGDVNGDGRPDLVVANSGDDTVSVLLNTTAPGAAVPAFAAQQTVATGVLPSAVALADVTGGGKLDLLVANGTDNTVSLLRNTTAPGATTISFAAQQTFATGNFPKALAVANLNGAGRRDVVVANNTDATVSALVNTPAEIVGNFATGTIMQTPPIMQTLPTVQFGGGTVSESDMEGGGTFNIMVTLSAASGVATTIPFTLGGTAVAGVDFSGVTASPLVIPAGQLSASISGTLLDDNAVESNAETLIFTLGTPTNATLGSATVNTLTITEDNDATTSATTTTSLQVSLNPAVPGQVVVYTVTVHGAGGSGTPTGNVTLTGLPGGPVQVALHDGSASFSAPAVLGRFAVTASYAATSGFLSSQSAAVTEVVQLFALQPGARRNVHSFVIGTTAGKDLITVAKHGKNLIVTLRQLTHGHLHSHQVVLAAGVTKIIVVGQRSLDQVVLSHGVKLPIVFVKPVGTATKHR